MKTKTLSKAVKGKQAARVPAAKVDAGADSRDSSKFAELRGRATAELRAQRGRRKLSGKLAKSESNSQQLYHELQVHQLELVLQNEELKLARDKLESALNKYTELYDNSPVGYFTLDTHHRIQMVNLTGAQLIGSVRNRLVGQPFATLVGAESRHELGLFLEKVFTRKLKQTAEFPLGGTGNSTRFLQIRAIRSPDGQSCSIVVVDITDLRNHERALRESEARLVMGMQVAELGLAEIDYTSGLNHLTAEAAYLFGFEKKAMAVPRSVVHALFYPADRPELTQRIAASLDPVGRGWFSMDHRVQWPDGTVRWLRVRKQVYFEGSGKSRRAARAILAVLDVTDQKHAEESLRVSEIRYRRLFETAHDGVLLLDPTTRKITDANPFMTTLLGYSHAQLVGKELFEIGLHKDAVSSQEMFRKLKREHEVRYEDLPLKAKSGQPQQVEVVANQYQEDNQPIIQCNIRDITARKRVEQDLAEKARLLDLSHDAIIVRDVHGRIRYWNNGAEALYGWTRNEAVGKISNRLLQTSYLTPLKQLKEVLHRTNRWTGELVHQTRDGRRITVFVRKTQDRDPEGRPASVLEINTDITARKQADEAQRQIEVLAATNRNLHGEIMQRRAVESSLRDSEREQKKLLEHSERMQGQLRLLSRKILHVQEEERKRVSRELHDVIAQTLTGINLRLAALAKIASTSVAGLDEAIAETQRLVEESVGLVHQFARELRPATLDDLGLIPALQSLIRMFAEKSRLHIELKATTEIGELDTDRRTVLYRVAQEALTNVARHAHAKSVVVQLRRLRGTITLEIQDDGRSFSVDQVFKATGNKRLGLVGMRERVEMVGGTFNIDSLPGIAQGTIVRVTIPISQPTRRPSGT